VYGGQMSDPWAFGWTQVFTIIGFCITIAIAIGGFRTFGRWKREKIEELRMGIALDALSLAYESQFVFDGIRNSGSFGYESEDAKKFEGESDEDFARRKTFYVILKRVDDNKDFFARVFKLQPHFMAVFGPENEQLHLARVDVVIAAQMLSRRDTGPWTEEKSKRLTRLEADVWSGMAAAYSKEELPEGDRVQKKLDDFKNGIATLCRPIVNREFKLK